MKTFKEFTEAKKQKPFMVVSPSSYKTRQIMGKYKTRAEAEKALKTFQPHMPKDHKPLEIRMNEACWDGYKQVGMKKKNGKKVPNCVPEEAELDEVNEELEDFKAILDDDFAELEEGIVGDVMRKLKVNVKMKKFIRWYLDWRRDNPKQGMAGLVKAVKILGLDPSDAKTMAKKINDMIASGELPKHLAIAEDAPVNAVGTDGGVDMNPTGKPKKMDRRSKYYIDNMFRRASGQKRQINKD